MGAAAATVASRLAGGLARGLERALHAACGIVLALALALVFATTLQRYALSSGYLGAEEAATWLLLLVACLGFPLVADGPLAMRVELYAPAPGGRGEALRAALAEAFVLAACLALALAGAKAALAVGGTSPLLGLGEWLRPAALAASGAAAFVLRALVLAGQGRARRLLASAAMALAALALVAAGPALPAPPSLAAVAAIGLGIAVAAPLPHVFALASYLALAFGSPLVEPALALSALDGIGRHVLLAIPFFLLAGGLLIVSGLADDLVRLAAALVGRRRGGLGQTLLATSVMFSGISGSSIANAAFSSRTFLGPLVANGYAPERAGALIAATAVLDNIIPFSIAFLILSAATGLPVGPLFVGGLAAGLFLAAALAFAIHATAGGLPAPAPPAAPRARLALRALPVLGLALVVTAGIRLGIVTPTEAAGLAAAYMVAATLAARRGGGMAAAFCRAGAEAAAILMLIGAAAPLAFLLAAGGVAQAAAGLALSLGNDPFAVMLAANLLLLVVGLALDIGAAILLFAPLLLPVAVASGIDPVHFGVVLVVNLMIGGLTPPVGILVQVVAATAGLSAARLFSAVLPYLAALLAALLCMGLAVAAHAALSRP